jgi:3-deoxy-D-manno-oct-2-ulosonic acid (Kdo) hydroxylase
MITNHQEAGRSRNRHKFGPANPARLLSAAKFSSSRSLLSSSRPMIVTFCWVNNGRNFACTRMSPIVLPGGAESERVHAILRSYSSEVISFVSKFLAPYSGKLIVDFASFRPLEEDGRALPLHKRNDLLHVDAFPSRPTRGGRILRVFTNLNPTKPRVWQITGPFESLAKQFAEHAGLQKIAAKNSRLSRTVQHWGSKLGVRGIGRTPYDAFMLRFHDYLKENSDFQSNCSKVRLEFPPMATWLVYTDGVAHAVMSGQYAMEQTFLIPAEALVSPGQAPYRILEKIAGAPLIQ